MNGVRGTINKLVVIRIERGVQAIAVVTAAAFELPSRIRIAHATLRRQRVGQLKFGITVDGRVLDVLYGYIITTVDGISERRGPSRLGAIKVIKVICIVDLIIAADQPVQPARVARQPHFLIYRARMAILARIEILVDRAIGILIGATTEIIVGGDRRQLDIVGQLQDALNRRLIEIVVVLQALAGRPVGGLIVGRRERIVGQSGTRDGPDGIKAFVLRGLGIGSVALMLLGTQWYILFNVIAGAMAIPSEMREVANLFRFRTIQRWTTVILPGIFPYLVTGLVTASGGAWNASIIAEYFHLRDHTLMTLGLGAQISAASDAGNFGVLLMGTIIMATMVVTVNRLLWRRLYHLAETKYRLD